MAVKRKMYFAVICDGCGQQYTDAMGAAAWEDEGTARIVADLGEWHVEEHRQLCRNCRTKELIKGGNTYDP